ncbi:MAG: hypothetical protein HKN18_07245 [Silicimonas sp.]|nr:hypothetical protein [Silicimonas sp.]
MEERLSDDDVNVLMSSIRTGTPLAEARRQEFVVNTKALLANARSYNETCHHLADLCLEEVEKFDPAVRDDWKDGVVEEIQWWWTWINTLRRQGKLASWAHLRDRPFPFEDAVTQFPAGIALRCLNIGCGPRPDMGQQSAADIEFVHMDPLAPAYNKLMRFLNAPGGGDVVFGAVEFLGQMDLEPFDFIAAKNCLDHAYDVPRGLEQMISCLGKRGMISLGHYENEAEAQNYMGFHKWNIEVRDGRIRVWSKNASEVFDHESAGFRLEVVREDRRKASGQTHPFLDLTLIRGW